MHGAAAHGAMLPQIAQMPIQVKPFQDNSLDPRFNMIQIHVAFVFVCSGSGCHVCSSPYHDVFPMFFALEVAFKHLDSPFMTNFGSARFQQPAEANLYCGKWNAA